MDKHRLYGRTPDLATEDLKRVFGEMPEIHLALLFGSRALGTQTPRSDYDFAVLADTASHSGWGIMADLRNHIQEKLRLAETDFDLVDLHRADKAVLSAIKSGYILLKGSEHELQRLFTENPTNRS